MSICVKTAALFYSRALKPQAEDNCLDDALARSSILGALLVYAGTPHCNSIGRRMRVDHFDASQRRGTRTTATKQKRVVSPGKNLFVKTFADDLRQEPVFVKTIINRYLILLPTDPRFLHTHREVMGNIVLHASSDSDVTRSKGHRS